MTKKLLLKFEADWCGPCQQIKPVVAAVQEQFADQLIAGITELLQLILQKRPEYTTVVIEEIPPHNWGIGGKNYQDLILKKHVEKKW